MTFVLRCFEVHQQHTTKLSFSIDISGSHIAQNAGLRRKSGVAEVARGNKALQAANMLCCFSYSEQNSGGVLGVVDFHVKIKLSNVDLVLL